MAGSVCITFPIPFELYTLFADIIDIEAQQLDIKKGKEGKRQGEIESSERIKSRGQRSRERERKEVKRLNWNKGKRKKDSNTNKKSSDRGGDNEI